jgi:hypothetical protein
MSPIIARIIAGALISIAFVDAIIVAVIIISDDYGSWSWAAEVILIFSFIVMFIPALIASTIGETILRGGMKTKRFVLLGGIGGFLLGSAMTMIFKIDLVVIALWGALGLAGGLVGAYSMSLMFRCAAANKPVHPSADAPAD